MICRININVTLNCSVHNTNLRSLESRKHTNTHTHFEVADIGAHNNYEYTYKEIVKEIDRESIHTQSTLTSTQFCTDALI